MNEDRAILDDKDRTLCEVYTRVMGYHRPVDCFNVYRLYEEGMRPGNVMQRQSGFV
jgi:hypothetical protein